LKQQGPLWVSHGREERTNGAYGNRSHGGHRSDIDGTMRDGRLLDTSDRRGDGYMYYSSYGSDRNRDRHEYTENMKVRIATFSLKGKADIWWEDVKWDRDIMMEDLSLHEFKRIFGKEYLLERYYNIKVK